MSRTEQIGNQLLWLIGHLAFTIVTVCCIRGGYEFYREAENYMRVEFDLSSLSSQDKEQLAAALIEDGYSVPKNIK